MVNDRIWYAMVCGVDLYVKVGVVLSWRNYYQLKGSESYHWDNTFVVVNCNNAIYERVSDEVKPNLTRGR